MQLLFNSFLLLFFFFSYFTHEPYLQYPATTRTPSSVATVAAAAVGCHQWWREKEEGAVFGEGCSTSGRRTARAWGPEFSLEGSAGRTTAGTRRPGGARRSASAPRIPGRGPRATVASSPRVIGILARRPSGSDLRTGLARRLRRGLSRY